jgi:hypothetical protein
MWFETWQYDCLIDSEIKVIFKNLEFIQMLPALGLGMWCLTPLSKFCLVEEAGVSNKTTLLPWVTDTLYHIMLYPLHLAWACSNSQS